MKSSDTMIGGTHYKELPIPPYEYCQYNKLNCLESNVVKYLTRHRDKGGLDDLNKAKHCIDLIIEWEYREEPKPGDFIKADDIKPWLKAMYRGVPNPRK